jgi:2-phosphosulfolactate phosphatase
MDQEPQIRITDFVDGARNARGAVVIIDVFRAFSTACYAFANGARRIIPVADIAHARKLRETDPGLILMGERGGKKLPGFDFGNSPTEIRDADFTGKVLVHTTHAGTQGIVNALHASTILTGALVNARATASYIRSLSLAEVTLVRMGLQATRRSDEDDICAEYLAALIRGEDFDVTSISKTLALSPFSKRFFDPGKPWSPPSDFEMCLDINRFDFAIRAVSDSTSGLFLEKCP